MQVDPRISRRKYQREVERLSSQRSLLESRGIFMLGTSVFPHVHFVFVPRHPVQLVAKGRSVGSTLILPEGTLIALEIPSVAGRAFKAVFDLSDYDLRAPSLEFRNPWDDSPLQYDSMFRALEYEKGRKAHVVLLGDHPVTHKPFLCLRGFREYHEHPQHAGDEWLRYRSDMSLFSAVLSLWRASLDLVRPIIAPGAGGQIQVLWQPDEKV